MSQPANKQPRLDDAHWQLRGGDNRPGRNPVVRYIGQHRRGRILPAAQDDLDLIFTMREIAEGRAMLAEAHAIGNRRARRAAIAAAVARLALGGRMLDLVVERRAGVGCDCVEVTP